MSKEKEKEKDFVAEIMDKWYKAMEANKINVQPKVSTILGTILAGYKIDIDTDKRDVWAEYLTVTGGEFPTWFATLTPTERKEFEIRRADAKESWEAKRISDSTKQFLKG